LFDADHLIAQGQIGILKEATVSFGAVGISEAMRDNVFRKWFLTQWQAKLFTFQVWNHGFLRSMVSISMSGTNTHRESSRMISL